MVWRGCTKMVQRKEWGLGGKGQKNGYARPLHDQEMNASTAINSKTFFGRIHRQSEKKFYTLYTLINRIQYNATIIIRTSFSLLFPRNLFNLHRDGRVLSRVCPKSYVCIIDRLKCGRVIYKLKKKKGSGWSSLIFRQWLMVAASLLIDANF